MLFARPVDALHPVKTEYGEKIWWHDWSIDPVTGFWVPVKGNDGYGNSRGTDFDCPPGTGVRAMSDGFIVRSSLEGAALYITQLVTLLGFDSWVLKYENLRGSFVYPGQTVKQGQYIAESGAPHLHVDLMNLNHQWRPLMFDS